MIARVLAGNTAARRAWAHGVWVVGQKQQGAFIPVLRTPDGIAEFSPTPQDIEADDWQPYTEGD